MEETQIMPEYEPISIRGSGAFGYVVEAYDRVHDKRVAIKRTHKVSTRLSREFEVLSEIKDCENVIKLLDTFYSVDSNGKMVQNLVFEYVSFSLDALITKYKDEKKIIPIEKIKQISKQLLKGLDYCHKKNVVHRDLKPENVLLTQDHTVKICDFGSSKIIKEGAKSTPYITSRYYRAPELLFGMSLYNEKIDIFAAGCIIAELFILSPLLPGKTEGMQIFELMTVIGNPEKDFLDKFDMSDNMKKFFDGIKIGENVNNLEKIIKTCTCSDNSKEFYKKDDIKNAADLIYHMLAWDPDKRYSAEQCLKHKFFN